MNVVGQFGSAVFAETTSEGVFYWELETVFFRSIAMIPALLIMLIGTVIALRKYAEHPRSSKALLTAMALFGLNIFGLPIVQVAILTYTTLDFFGHTILERILLEMPSAIIYAVIWFLLLIAVFDRPKPPKFLAEPPQSEHPG